MSGVDIITLVDGTVRRRPGRLKALVYPEQVEALEAEYGTEVESIALECPENVVWKRPDEPRSDTWLMGDMRLPAWQRTLVAEMLANPDLTVSIVRPRPNRRQRVIADAHMVVAAMMHDARVVLAGPDDRYAAEVRAGVEAILERLGE